MNKKEEIKLQNVTGKTFIKIVPSKKKEWINDIYYGINGSTQHGHFVASGAISCGEAIIANETMENFECEQPLYHRNSEGKILFDTKIKR